MSAHEKRFKIALSYPGEHRPFVEGVAAMLAQQIGRDRVLYDKYLEAEFARPDLDTYLQHLYHDESELIAVFLCADYQRKEFCGLEWRAIRDLIKKRDASAVMPLRFDNTEIPGLFSTDGYIWIANRPSQEVADLILRRLQLNASPSITTPPTRISVAGSETVSINPAPTTPPSPALTIWRKKLAFLLVEEARTVDADQKFRLRELIEEAEQRIRDHGGQR